MNEFTHFLTQKMNSVLLNYKSTTYLEIFSHKNTPKYENSLKKSGTEGETILGKQDLLL